MAAPEARFRVTAKNETERAIAAAAKGVHSLSDAAAFATRSFAGLVGVFGAKQIIDVADSMRTIEARIRSTVSATTDWAAAQNKLTESSIKTGLALEDSLDQFEGLALIRDDIGATDAQLLTVLDTIQSLGIVGGSSADRINAGFGAFNLAMVDNIVNIREFNQLIKNTPEVAKAIADEMGKTVGQVQSLAKAGKLTSEEVFNALLQQADEANEKIGKFPQTFERSIHAIGTALSVTIGNIDAQLAASKGAGSFLGGFAKDLTEAQGAIVSAIAAVQEFGLFGINAIHDRSRELTVAFLEIEKAALTVGKFFDDAGNFLNEAGQKAKDIEGSFARAILPDALVDARDAIRENIIEMVDLGAKLEKNNSVVTETGVVLQGHEDKGARILALEQQILAVRSGEVGAAAELQAKLDEIAANREALLAKINAGTGTADDQSHATRGGGQEEDPKAVARREKLLEEMRKIDEQMLQDRLKSFGLFEQAEDARYASELRKLDERHAQLEEAGGIDAEIEAQFLAQREGLQIESDQRRADQRVAADEHLREINRTGLEIELEELQAGFDLKLAQELGFETTLAMQRAQVIEAGEDAVLSAKLKNAGAFKKMVLEMNDLSKKDAVGTAKFILGTLEGLTAGQAANSKKAFEINKAAGIADATISMFVGAEKAYAQFGAYGFVAAAAVIAAGLVNIAAIASTSFSGGGGGSGAVGGGSSFSGGAAAFIPDAPIVSATERNSLRLELSVAPRTGNIIADGIMENISVRVNEHDTVFVNPNSRQSIELRDSGLG